MRISRGSYLYNTRTTNREGRHQTDDRIPYCRRRRPADTNETKRDFPMNNIIVIDLREGAQAPGARGRHRAEPSPALISERSSKEFRKHPKEFRKNPERIG